MRKLLVTFSDNEVHQDIVFSMFECLYDTTDDVWVMAIDTPKVYIKDTPHTHLVKCPQRPGISKDTFNLKELYAIIHWINKQKFDVIFFETLHVWNLAIMMMCHKKTRIYQMIHDVIPHEGDKQEKVVRLMNRVVCKLADRIVICNKRYKDTIIKEYKVSQDNVFSIDMWRRFPEYTAPQFTKHVLFFGRLNPYKGVDKLLDIVKRCPHIYFDVVGRVDSQVVTIVEEIKKYPNVDVQNGYISEEDMIKAFTTADWIILPYNTATQSGVVIDGYRFGRPCVAYDVGALSEQIENGVSGYLVQAGSIDDFVDKLQQAVNMDRESYIIMSKNAYSYGLKKYAAEGAVERFTELLRK